MSPRPSETLAEHRNDVRRRILERGFENPMLFGSAARGDDVEGSDIDLLVTPCEGTGLLALSGLALDLEELLGVRVDLVSSRAGLADAVRHEAVPL